MERLIDAIYTPIENILVGLGIRGPLGTFAALSLVSAGVLMFVKPAMMFRHNGMARPWSMTADDNQQHEATALPWWLASILIGGAAAVFI